MLIAFLQALINGLLDDHHPPHQSCYKLDVGGKEVKVVTGSHGDVLFGEDHANLFLATGDTKVIGIGGDEERHVWVSASDDESAGKAYKMMIRAHGEHEGEAHAVWVDEGGDHHTLGEDANFVFVKRQSAAERLEESGLLDDVDEATREKILEFLRKEERHVVHTETFVVHEDDEEEEQ